MLVLIKSRLVQIGATVLFSYNTPVVAFVLSEYNPKYDGNGHIIEQESGYIKTDKFWSTTTSKHINKWLSSKGLNPAKVKKVDQSVLDNLIK